MNLSLSSLQSPDVHTIMKIKKQSTISLPCDKIRMTNRADIEPEYPFNNTPICVVHDIKTDLYYIVDGNYRFAQTVAWGRDTIDAWIIVEESKNKIYGKVSGVIFRYLDEKISFAILLRSAKESYYDTLQTKHPQAQVSQPFFPNYGREEERCPQRS